MERLNERISMATIIDREVFTMDYIQNCTFFNSRDLANVYDNGAIKRGYRPPRGLVCQFGQTLRFLVDKGIVKKYNNRQYVKVEV
jgi:hypothetical protein